METEKRKNFLINFCYIAVILGLLIIFAKFLIGYLLPFIIAGIIAFLMQAPSHFLSKKTFLKQNITAAVLSVLVYFFVAFLGIFLIYRLSVSLSTLTESLPQIFQKIDLFFDDINKKFSEFLPQDSVYILENFWNRILQNVAANVSSVVSSFLTKIAKSTPSFLFSSVVALVASCYIAKDYNRLLDFSKRLMGQRVSKNAIKIKNILFESVFKIAKGYIILSLLTFAEVLIGLVILKVKNALLLAILIAFVDILPVLGAGTILIPWAVFSAFLGNVPQAVGIALLYILIILIRNFCEPKIIGSQIGINPLFTLLAMFTGLRLFGVAGLFLFPVILIVVIKFYKE